ncbi:MAG TPA: GNAT family N-acetyltransferase [Rhodanobacteraceae bacterium]|jgi:putative acetyltransferase|nr:GNAT family N-acetyltransferase [Rhodanobacteraceae bacterium]
MSETFHIRAIEARDDAAMAAIIRSVMPEFGAGGAGFAIHDAEVDAMCAAYSKPRSAYFVLEVDGTLVGGCGVARLAHGEPDICELRKMYFLPQARGLGAGHAMIERCLAVARDFGFKRCYLETLTGMDAAQHLYRKHGFTPLCSPIGRTGHHGCDRWFIRTL